MSWECANCNAMMMIRDGEEPTEFCDQCAHDALAETTYELARIRSLLSDREQLAKSLLGMFWENDSVIVPSWESPSGSGQKDWMSVADKLRSYLLGEEK